MTTRADQLRLGASCGVLGTLLEMNGQEAWDKFALDVTPPEFNGWMTSCSVEECDRPATRRGMCDSHYRRMRRGSSKTGPIRDHGMTPAYFWSRVAAEGDCVVWTGCTNPSGYGQVGYEGRVVLAHRLAFFFRMDRWPDGLLRHLCNNPRCVLHVVEGTASENALDSVAAGTHATARRTHCNQGHLWSEENTYIVPSTGYRVCRACARIHDRKRPSGSVRARLAREKGAQ